MTACRLAATTSRWTSGASVLQALGFRSDVTAFRRNTGNVSQSGSVEVSNAFTYGASLGGTSTVDCFGSGRIVQTSEAPTRSGSKVVVLRLVFRLHDLGYSLSARKRATVAAAAARKLFRELRRAPFGSCKRT
jgi:hypothetical protein